MSAQFFLTYNETSHHFQLLADASSPFRGESVGRGRTGGNGTAAGVAADESSPESQAKQREALYYIVAVISFYALTFLVLFVRYARFKKRELDESVPYFPLPPDATNMATYTGSSREKTRSRSASSTSGHGGAGCPGDFFSAPASPPAEKADQLALRQHGARDSNYGSGDVTPKVMRVKMAPSWLCRKEPGQICDV